MRVSELIDLMATLGFARDTSTDKERTNYLRFLNLANLELWQMVINTQRFLQKLTLFLDDVGAASLPSGHYIKGVFSNGDSLSPCRLDNVFNIPEGQYSLIEGKLSVSLSGLQVTTDPQDGVARRYVTLLTVPVCKKLVEDVSDSENELDTPLYAEAYHLSLVHGALYYLFVSGNGFENKLKYQLINWDTSKKSFQTFYGVQ